MTHWVEEPTEHEYADAIKYLSLHYTRGGATRIVNAIKRAKTEVHQAVDILRAAAIIPGPADEWLIEEELRCISRPLPPVLLVRGRPLIIASGYHLICALVREHGTKNPNIPCKISPDVEEMARWDT